MIKFAQSLQDIAGALHLDHNEANNKIGKLKRIHNEPHDLEPGRVLYFPVKFRAIDSQHEAEVYQEHNDYQFHIPFRSLKLELVQLSHQVIH